MAELIHCFVCFAFPESGLKFYFASCAHIACYNCVKKGAFTLKCKVCKKENPRVLEINEKLPPQIAELFSPMDQSLEKFNQDFQQLLDFQQWHREHLVNNLEARTNVFDKVKEYAMGEVRKKDAYKHELLRQEAFGREADLEIARLEAEVAVATAVASSRRNTPRSSSRRSKKNDHHNNNNYYAARDRDSTLNLTAMTHDPFRTPAPRGGHRSFVTSTPLHEVSYADRSSFDASLSFSAATGFPKNPNSSGELSMLVNQTKGFNINRTTPKKCESSRARSRNSRSADERLRMNRCRSDERAKVDRSESRKSRLNMLSKTDPMPFK